MSPTIWTVPAKRPKSTPLITNGDNALGPVLRNFSE